MGPKGEESRPHFRPCVSCGQMDHLGRDSPKGEWAKAPERPAAWEWTRPEKGEFRCFNCGQRGHIAMKCPARALFCRGVTPDESWTALEQRK